MAVNFILLAMFWAGVSLTKERFSRNLREEAGIRAAKWGRALKTSPPYKGISNMAALRRQESMAGELSEALAYVRNMTIIGRGRRMSAQLLLEELADMSRLLAPAFTEMAYSIQICDKNKAAGVLYRHLPFSWAKDIGVFLAGWEDIPPEDLRTALETYTSALREERLTRQKRRDEMISDIIYFPVVVNAMTVLLNFIYTAYFLQQKDALEMLFNR